MALEEVVQAISLEGGDQIVAQLNKLAEIGEDTFNRITKAIEGGSGGFAAFGEGIAGVATAFAAATAATVAFVESQDRAITSLSALAHSFGTSIAGIEGIKQGFEEVGVSGTMLERGLGRMQLIINNQWSGIARSVRESATAQARDQLSIQEAVLGTEKAVEALSEANTHASVLNVHQSQEQARGAAALEAAQQKVATMGAHQAEDRVSAANSVWAAEQRLREVNNPGSVSKAEKRNLERAEAQATLEKARQAQAELPAKQALEQLQAQNALAEAQQKQTELATKQHEEQVKSQNAVKEAVLAVEKARIAETEAAQKSHDLDLKNLPKIAAQLNSIAHGQSGVKGAIDLTQVSAQHLSQAMILAAGGIDGLNKPQGIEVFTKLTQVFHGLGEGADAMNVKMELVQRLMSAGFRGGGASLAEMVTALDKGGMYFDNLIKKIEKSDYALTQFDESAAKDTVAAFETLEGTFGRVSEKLAALASPTITAWLNGIVESIENSDGILHIFIEGIQGVGAAFGAAITGVQNFATKIDEALNFDKGQSMKLILGAILVIIGLCASAFLAWPAIFLIVITAIGEIAKHWDQVKAILGPIGEIFRGWGIILNGIIGIIGSMIDKLREFLGLQDKAHPATPGSPTMGAGESSGLSDTRDYNPAAPAGVAGFSRGGLAGARRGYALGGLVGAIRGFAGGGGVGGKAQLYGTANVDVDPIYWDGGPGDTGPVQLDWHPEWQKFVGTDKWGIEWYAENRYGNILEVDPEAAEKIRRHPSKRTKVLSSGSFHAEGGHITGPGSGTSDSILARLSNGEFVVRAAAVRAYGADMFERLNNMQFSGFAMGGPVLAGVRPASGGSQKAGSTLNLSIDGQHFDGLHAPHDVAEKLTDFAIRRQTSSAGRAPSWMR